MVPGASKSEISGWLGDALKIRVAAQPEKGNANAAVVAVLASGLGLPEKALACFRERHLSIRLLRFRAYQMTKLGIN